MHSDPHKASMAVCERDPMPYAEFSVGRLFVQLVWFKSTMGRWYVRSKTDHGSNIKASLYRIGLFTKWRRP